MKIYCKQCKKDISKDVDKYFEKITIGKIRCKNCGAMQTRFISQTDLFLYYGVCEFVYIFLTIAAIYVYDNMSNIWWLTPLFVALLVALIPIQKYLSRFIYSKRFKKINYVEQKDDDANAKLRKEVNTSFMIFFAFAICAVLTPTYRIEFVAGEALMMIVTFVKFYMDMKNN